MSLARKDLLALLFISVLALIAYSNAFHGEFQYDDDRLIRFNFALRDFSFWESILRFEPFRPFTVVTYALNYNIGQKDPFTYHVFDFFLHLLATTLFYWFLRRNSSNQLLCFFAAALFAVHPLNTESVSYIASRFILLCAVFYWGALLVFDSYIRKPASYKPALFLFLFMLSAASKEEAALIPVAAVLYNYAFFGWSSVQKHRLFHAVSILLIAAGVLFRILHLYATQANLPHATNVYIATELFVWLRYLGLAIFPVPLNVDHFVEPLHLAHWKFWISLAAVSFILFGLWKCRRNHPWLFFWGAWFFFNLAPASFVPLNDFMAEHRTYISMFGFCACVAYTALLARSRSKLIPVALSFLILFYIAATIKRNEVWQNRITLWADAVQKSPQKYRPHINLAFVFYQLRIYDQALHEYLIARELNPHVPLVHSGLGFTLLELNRLEEAERSFHTALRLDPHFIDAKTGLGMLHYRSHEYEQALSYFVQTYPHRREARDLIVMMCDSYLKLGCIGDAARVLDEASKWEPRFLEIRRLLDEGKNREAEEQLQRLKSAQAKHRFPPP